VNRLAGSKLTDLNVGTIKLGLFFGSLLLGLALALNWGDFGGDGISYLDMGDALFTGHWKSILNALWSPLYPALLGVVRWVLKPSMRWYPYVIVVTNFAIYVGTLLSFHWFWASLLSLYRMQSTTGSNNVDETFSDKQFWMLGYAIFLFQYADLTLSTSPDMLLSSFVFLSAALLLRIRLGGPPLPLSCLLGVSLGLGYLAKAVMLPLSGFFFLSVFLLARPRRRSLWFLCASILVFVGIAGPYVFGLSNKLGFFTTGEAGSLNYAWHVNGLPFVHWQGGDPRLGNPQHPTHQIYSSPAIYEFEPSDGETYAPWYDPFYWMRGFHPRFNLRDQFVALKENLHNSLGTFWIQGAFITGIAVLLGMHSRPRQIPLEFMRKWYAWGPAAAAFLIYNLIWVEPRYLSPFFVLFWGAILTLVRLPQDLVSRQLLGVTSSILVFVLAMQTAGDLRKLVREEREFGSTQMQIAQSLRAKGILPGARVAVIDADLGADWQKLLGISVVAEIPLGEEERFWSMDFSARTSVIQTLRKTGAVILVASHVPGSAITAGWDRIGNTKAYMFNLTSGQEAKP
jgi:hypothetical protein